MTGAADVDHDGGGFDVRETTPRLHAAAVETWTLPCSCETRRASQCQCSSGRQCNFAYRCGISRRRRMRTRKMSDGRESSTDGFERTWLTPGFQDGGVLDKCSSPNCFHVMCCAGGGNRKKTHSSLAHTLATKNLRPNGGHCSTTSALTGGCRLARACGSRTRDSVWMGKYGIESLPSAFREASQSESHLNWRSDPTSWQGDVLQRSSAAHEQIFCAAAKCAALSPWRPPIIHPAAVLPVAPVNAAVQIWRRPEYTFCASRCLFPWFCVRRPPDWRRTLYTRLSEELPVAPAPGAVQTWGRAVFNPCDWLCFLWLWCVRRSLIWRRRLYALFAEEHPVAPSPKAVQTSLRSVCTS